jgi:hypothetical protein
MDIRHLAALLLISLPALAHGSAPGDIQFRDGAESGLLCTQATPGEVTMDLRSLRVQPVFRLDGRSFPAQSAHSASFHLIPQEGEPIPLGFSDEPSPAAVRVLAGVYDVEYRWVAGSLVPRNHAARVLHGVLLDRDTTLRIDVPSQTLSGDLLLNGTGFPIAGATLSLKSLHRLGEVPLGSTPISSYSLRLIPGAYQLHYVSRPQAWASMPANRNAHWGRFEIEPRRDTLDLDLPSISARFLFRFDGAQAPAVGSENGAVSLRTAEGDRIDLGQTRQLSTGWNIVPGNYDVHYEGLTGAEVAPANRDTRVASARSFVADQHIIDIPTVQVEGRFQFNGLPSPDLGSESGEVHLRDRHTGVEVLLGLTRNGNFVRRVIPGHYDLVYRRIAGAELAPQNPSAVIERARPLLQADAGSIDIRSERLDFQLTLDGLPFLQFPPESMLMRLRSDDDLEPIWAGSTGSNGGLGSLRLLAGSYTPLVSRIAGAELVPDNSLAAIEGRFSNPQAGPALQQIDVRTGEFQIAFTHNGIALPSSSVDVAGFQLRHVDDLIDIGDSQQSPRRWRLVTNAEAGPDQRGGTLYYTRLSGVGPNLPRNTGSPAGCVIFSGGN